VQRQGAERQASHDGLRDARRREIERLNASNFASDDLNTSEKYAWANAETSPA
jgi:hypothetical protein